MRNHLAVVLLSAECLRLRAAAGDAAAELGDLRKAAERASLLTFELLTAHATTAVRVAVDVNEIVAPLVESLGRLAGKHAQVAFRPSAEPARAVATPAEVERILLNLSLNALSAMPDGGVLTIDTAIVDHVRDAEILERPEPHVRLRVSDTGRGMTPEVKARIFEPFFTTGAHSTGMGLSSVAFTVRQLDGRLFVESEPEAGTRATVLLPFAASDATRSAAR